jgi:hypothetical protein
MCVCVYIYVFLEKRNKTLIEVVSFICYIREKNKTLSIFTADTNVTTLICMFNNASVFMWMYDGK